MNPAYRAITVSLLLVCQVLFLMRESHAERNPDDNLQLWVPVIFNSKISKRVLGSVEVQPRVILSGTNDPNALTTLILRPMLGVQVSKAVSIWQGYGWTPAFNPGFRSENRLFQQLLVENKFRYFTLSNRTRLEERFIQRAGETSFRGRHRLLVKVPLGNGKWSLLTYDEIFVNLNDTPSGPKSGFDQNRLFVGINRKLNQYLDMEIGYLHNYVNNAGPARDRLNHAILLGLNVQVR